MRIIPDKKLSFSRTRLAPTPSGYLHLGNISSFALTVFLARRSGARVLLRIDDGDQERAQRKYIEDIFETLDYLRIPFDEGPRDFNEFTSRYSQLHRLSLYNEALAQLEKSGCIFACDCSRAKLLQQGGERGYPSTCRQKSLSLYDRGCAWRADTDTAKMVMVRSMDGTVIEKTLPPPMHHFVVRRRDGLPSYQLASLVDDLFFGVDLIVRGADLWPSTLAQVYLGGLLGAAKFAETTFFHHQLARNQHGEKPSKSAGATSVHGLRKEGRNREAIFGEAARLLGIGTPVGDWETLAAAWIASAPAPYAPETMAPSFSRSPF